MTTPTAVVTSLDELRAAVGTDLGPGDWVLVDQARIDAFAQATGDHQWIHVDPVRAATGPYGGTVAHGYLTLSLVPVLIGELVRLPNVRMGINYGLNRVRFPAPVPSGSRVRAGMRLLEVADLAESPGAIQVTSQVTVVREGGQKPVCVAELVARYHLGAQRGAGAPGLRRAATWDGVTWSDSRSEQRQSCERSGAPWCAD